MLLASSGVPLPVISSLQDCASFSHTVEPYLPQLRDLPQQVYAHISSIHDLKALYLSTNPLVSSFAFSLFLAPIFIVVSEANKNYSQVDRLWSILPTVYNAHYAIWTRCAGLPTEKVDNVLAVSCVWSLRLTYNYWRKGGYTIGSEDYRWEIIKKAINPALFFLLNVTFIATIQSVLLWYITAPTYVLLLSSISKGAEMTGTDLLFTRGILALVIIEYFADQQQWNYQKAKTQYLKTAKVPSGYKKDDLDRGFITTGLWSWSRHPNFLAEQAVWVMLYQWASFSTMTVYNWTGVGAFALLLLFQASTMLTEQISAGKYPDYKIYQKAVGKFLPNLLGGKLSFSQAQ